MSLDKVKSDILNKLQQNMNLLSEYQKYNKLEFIFTEEPGISCRDEYVKHWNFMQAGAQYRFRMLAGGNGSGKSFTMAAEIAYHATGLYPNGWTGKVFNKIKTIWIIAETGELFRDSMQQVLFGNAGEDIGTGLLPLATKRPDGVGITNTNSRPGVPGGIGSALIKHKNGQHVQMVLKTFDMRRENLQAATVDLVCFDEEPPEDVYNECVMRTRGTRIKEPGISILAFTPLKGLTDVVMRYLPNGQFPIDGEHPEEKNRYAIAISWAEAPHLSEEDKAVLMSEIPPNLRDSRTKGIPAVGAGRIFPINEDDVIVRNLKIEAHWKRAYGLDFGWKCTAAVWGAKDPNTGIIYLYGEYYRGEQAPYVHANAISHRGKFLKGAPDPAGGGTNIKDGTSLIQDYMGLGLNLATDWNGKSMVDNGVHSGIAKMLNLFDSGLLKVAYNLENWLKEFRLYRYDTKDANRVAPNQADHLMDATRYLISIFDQIAVSPLDYDAEGERNKHIEQPHRIGIDPVTGY